MSVDPQAETPEIKSFNLKIGQNLFHCSNLVRAMGVDTYQPLELRRKDDSKTEYDRFREAAKSGPPREELVGLTLLDSGMRNTAMAHMVESWTEWRGDKLIINIPPYERCEVGSSEKGKGGDRSESGEPCWYCAESRNSEGKDWLPPDHKLPDDGDCWHPKSRAGWEGRQIPIKEEDTQQIIESWFRVYDTVCSQDAVRTAVKRIAKRAGIFEPGDKEGQQDWPTPHDLRDTYGTQLALMGFNRDEIKAPMGHAGIEQADSYIKLSGVESTPVFDKKWNKDELK